MGKGKFLAYYRVSTDRQGRSGLGLEAQRRAVLDHLAGGQWELVGELVEVESGRRGDRPKLLEALTLCRLYNAILVIAKLDRLSRNVAFISNLMESGVDFVAVDFPQANRLTVHILAAVAEHEREMISQRTRAALAAARARGTRLGGDRGQIAAQARKGAEASGAVRKQKADRRARDLMPIILALQAEGRSLNGIAREFSSRGFSTARGGAWTATQVGRVVKRASAVRTR